MMGDGRRTEAEANYNLGISSEKDKKLDQAVTYMEIFYTLSKDKNWENVDGENLHKNGCESLNRMYTTIAEQVDLEYTFIYRFYIIILTGNICKMHF